jgi:hypothetical protein
MGASAVFLFFFMDETMYPREIMEKRFLARTAEGRRAPSENSSTEPAETTKGATANEKSNEAGSNSSLNLEAPETGVMIVHTKPTLWEKYRLFRVIPEKENKLLPMMTRPLLHLWNFPIMAMGGLYVFNLSGCLIME